jgi:hypothetical protein
VNNEFFREYYFQVVSHVLRSSIFNVDEECPLKGIQHSLLSPDAGGSKYL